MRFTGYIVPVRRILHFVLSVLSRTPLIRWFRSARALRNQYVDPQVRQLRAVIKEMRAGEIDVLYLGDSSATFFGADDEDKRRLPEMLQAELDPGVRLRVISGAGYNPALYAEFVRLLATLEQRPKAVILTRAVRTCGALHVREHPEYGYQRSVATLRKVPDARHRLRAFSRANRRTPEEYEAFHELATTTRWQQSDTVGESLKKIRGRRLAVTEDLTQQRALFDYFHGETFGEDFPGLEHLRTLGTRLREYGVPVVHYWPPVPWQKGEEYFPGEFRSQLEANFALVAEAFEEPLGDLGRRASDPLDTPVDEFIDAADGTEHWNTKGRRRMAGVLARLLREAGV